MDRYRMPNGRTYQFAPEDVPEGAVKVASKPSVENKAEEKMVVPANKAKKVSKK